jgi:small subunit ribosomal protein S6
MVVFDLAVAETGGADAGAEQLTRLVESRGGRVLKVDHWGRRRMAYPIRRALDGDYLLSRVELEPSAVSELESSLKINEKIYRHLVVRADELPVPAPPREPRLPRPEIVGSDLADAPEAVGEEAMPEAEAAVDERPAAEAPEAETIEAEPPVAEAEPTVPEAEAVEAEAPVAEAPEAEAAEAEAPAAMTAEDAEQPEAAAAPAGAAPEEPTESPDSGGAAGDSDNDETETSA